MRFTTTPSYRPYYLSASAAIIMWLLPVAVLAMTITSVDGCFLQDSAVVRFTEPTCQLTIENDTGADATITLRFENIDPDAIAFSGAKATITKRQHHYLVADLTAPAGSTTVTAAPWYTVGDDFYFIATSDNQARGTVETNPIFDEVLAQVTAINPLFFTNSGDLVQGSSSADTLQDMFTAVQQTVAETSVPMYPVPGNHDYNSNLSIYQSFFGQPNYSYDMGGVHFIGLSTSGITSRGVVSNDQLSWLEAEFAQTTQPYTIIYYHHPLSVPSWGKPTCCFEDNTNRDALAELLDRERVDFIINGHSQGYDYRYLSSTDVATITLGMYQLITGGSGGHIAEPDGDYHFTLVHVTPTGIAHQVITEDQFGTAVDYSNNNGQHTRAQAVIENSSQIDLPYLRLKFRLHSSATSFLISDDSGEYYHTYQAHANGADTVVYVETSVPAKTSYTITIQPATVIHTGITQTIDSQGMVTYQTVPTSTATAIPLTVTPADASTTVSAVTAAADYYTWTETPSVAGLYTTYTLTGLPANAMTNVTMNGQLIDRPLANAAGKIQFSYAGVSGDSTATTRSFSVRVLPEAPNDIITLPASLGTSQVRIFSSAGQVRGQWEAFAGSAITDNALWRADVTGDGTDEVIIYQPETAAGNLRIYTIAGEEIDRLTVAAAPVIGDIIGHGQAQLLYVQAQSGTLTLWQYDDISHQFTSSVRQLPTTVSRRTSVLTAADITNDGIADLVAYDYKRHRLLALTAADDNVVVARSYRFPYAGSVVAVAPGHFQAAAVIGLVVVFQRPSGQETVWYFRPHGHNAWRRNFGQRLTTPLSTIMAAALQPGVADRLVTITTAGQMNVYRVGQRGWRNLQRLTLTAGTAASWQLGVLNGGATLPQKLLVSETTAPGRVTIWQYDSTSAGLQAAVTWYGYGESFPGGTIFAGR